MALKSYQKAIAISPNYADAYNNLGNLLFERLDDFKKLQLKHLEWAVAYKHDFAESI